MEGRSVGEEAIDSSSNFDFREYKMPENQEDKYNSSQERLVAEYCGISMSKPFVFAPDEWRPGMGPTNEPADLVWTIGNVIILMHMTYKEYTSNKSQARRKRNSAIKHNKEQVQDWMKLWREGQPLRGSNELRSFSINYSKNLHVVALSIIQCDDMKGFVDEDFARKIDVRVHARIPDGLIKS